MKRLKHSLGIVRDERAQSLTECAIAIPIILLMFFAMLQYVAIVQAYQLGNYAAYAAARSYAVHAALSIHETGDDGRAQDYAKTAAAMALAPIARLMPGEAEFLGSDLAGISLTEGESGLLSLSEKLVQGFIVAKYLRLNSSLLGGGISVQTSGSPKQVDVEINYPQPIYVPGLAELWNYVVGDKIFTSMKPLREGLGGIPKAYGEYQVKREELGSLDIPDFLEPYIGFCPHINIRSKCSIGYEEWGDIESYRPRFPGTVDDEEKTDPALEQQAKDMEQATKDLEDAKKKVDDAEEALKKAKAATQAAKAERDKYAPGTDEYNAADQKYQDALAEEAKRGAEYEAAVNDANEITKKLEELTK